MVSLYWTDKLYLDEQSIVPNYEVGKSYDMIYGLHSLGINPLTGYPVFLTPDGKEKQGTEQLTRDDFIALGHLTPPYSGSFYANFSYKQFDFDISFYYVFGGKQRFNYQYVRDKDKANYNAVAGQTARAEETRHARNPLGHLTDAGMGDERSVGTPCLMGALSHTRGP